MNPQKEIEFPRNFRRPFLIMLHHTSLLLSYLINFAIITMSWIRYFGNAASVMLRLAKQTHSPVEYHPPCGVRPSRFPNQLSPPYRQYSFVEFHIQHKKLSLQQQSQKYCFCRRDKEEEITGSAGMLTFRPPADQGLKTCQE